MVFGVEHNILRQREIPATDFRVRTLIEFLHPEERAAQVRLRRELQVKNSGEWSGDFHFLSIRFVFSQPSHALASKYAQNSEAEAHGVKDYRDRKSTRLNSS